MTSRYISLIQQTLDLKYPQKTYQEQLNLENIKFKLFLPKTTSLLVAYQELKSLSITHCDLRNLQNFPKLPHLQELDLGFNQIQGTFNYLIPLKRLKYLNIEDNIVFESNKFAPLKKIVSATRISQQSSTNNLKICICLRNNPFADEESSYINKLKGYGLKVVKEPKEYFDKKKTEDEKANKSAKKTQKFRSKNKNKKIENRKDKKQKRREFEELDSFYSGESIVSQSSSSSSSSDGDNNNNNNNPNRSIMNSNQGVRPYHRAPHQMNLQNNIRPRLAIRLSQQSQLNFRNVIENPFMNSEDMNGIQNGLFVMDDDSEESEEINVDRFGGSGNQVIEQRLRVLEERRARLLELRGMRRELTIERERERLERLREIERREQLLRQRHAREREIVRQLEENRQRLLVRPSMLIRDQNHQSSTFGAMRNSSNNLSALEDDWQVDSFRRRSSGASGTGLAVRIDTLNNQTNNDNNSSSNNNLNNYLNQMRTLQRNTSRNSNDFSLSSPAYQPLRVRQSSEFPGIIRISRMDSYHSQNSNAIPGHRQNQIVRESHQIRFGINDSVSNDDNNQNDQNQLDDDDNDDIDQLIQDENDDDQEDEMIHVCDEGCQHNVEQQDEEDDLDGLEDQQDEEDENQNQEQSEESDVNNNHNFYQAMEDNNDEIENFLMNDEMIEILPNDWSANLMRPPQNNRDGNPSLSSNPNPESESNLENQGQEEDSSQQL